VLLGLGAFVSVSLKLEQIVVWIRGLDMTSACLSYFDYHGVFNDDIRRGANGLLCSGNGECVCNQCRCQVSV